MYRFGRIKGAIFFLLLTFKMNWNCPITHISKSLKGIHYFVALTYWSCKVLRHSKMAVSVYPCVHRFLRHRSYYIYD